MKDQGEILFIGTTYVYRGPYPRSEQLAKKQAVKRAGGFGQARLGQPRIADDTDEVERDSASREERSAAARRAAVTRHNRGEALTPKSAGNGQFGHRGGYNGG